MPARGCAAIVARLANSSRPGDVLARHPARLDQILAETRARGYGTRDPDFGGHYDQPRSRANDGRSSIAVPILVHGEVVGCVNLTWIAKVAIVKTITERLLPDLHEAARSIGNRMSPEDALILGMDCRSPRMIITAPGGGRFGSAA